ncbi:alpha-L-arabinofuranosidase C-terminal domain-containing protein [Sunxiuqinia sp. A32]|uniref:alpha-L-arabinofuranosidase C-terminal domain-containing protein n=1 Tax=Sunxiuqinia sp. A32 TaxID=3461496 RepID=UPI00404651D7
MKPLKLISIFLFLLFYVPLTGHGQSRNDLNVLKIDFANSKKVSPIEYGWHYEEIGMIGEGGLFAEMVRNRAFEEANPPRGLEVENGYYANVPNPTENPRKKAYLIDPLVGWSKFPENNKDIELAVVDTNPLNEFNPHSLQIELGGGTTGTSGVVNNGFFGMYFKQGNLYKLSFYSRGEEFDGSLNVFLCDSTGEKISNVFEVKSLTGEWDKYSAVFEAKKSTDTGILYFEPKGTGKLFLDVVSMFPGDTWDDGKSVFRADIMRNLIDYAPDFLRFPGGCLVHGVNVETMYRWKETVGDIAERPGAWSKWSPNYRTDGLGYHEFYELCEYLNCDAMYVAPAGLACSFWLFKADEKDEYLHFDVDVQDYIQDALDAIEYAIGPVDSEWGSKRAANGHPKPFPLKYISVGNEDFGPTYYRNYDAFYRAVKMKYPQLKIIANSMVGESKDADMKRERIPEFVDPSTIDIFDEHYYKDVPWVIENYYKFDQYQRPGPDMFIGELGIRGRHPLDVLGEAVFMTTMERNADLNPMMADRPLMRNWDFVGGRGNPLFFHTNSTSFKTFNYYMSKLFRDNKIDIWYESKNLIGESEKKLDENYLFSSAGFDSQTNEVVIKVVNLQEKSISSKLKIGDESKTIDATITILSSDGLVKNTPERPYAEYLHVEDAQLNLQGEHVFQPKSLTVIRFKSL